jgi:hypothetical protein
MERKVRERRKEERWRKKLACGGGEVPEIVGQLSEAGRHRASGKRITVGWRITSDGYSLQGTRGVEERGSFHRRWESSSSAGKQTAMAARWRDAGG